MARIITLIPTMSLLAMDNRIFIVVIFVIGSANILIFSFGADKLKAENLLCSRLLNLV